ncbi:hypothetical protein [Arthrobacter sp. L77]|uniref:hypothetical protein n=1 Tax=Arthrobacter sp. L77 TaxID=1496689 RepID=UPI0005B842F8|nr:hypothetical protein [Arthrobacter sp. L77]
MTEPSSAGHPDGGTRAPGHPDDGHSDGRPAPDRREEILEPSPGAGHHAASIRDEQGIHEAGAVPPAYDGDDPAGGQDDAHHRRRPEDAALEHDTWDGGAADR